MSLDADTTQTPYALIGGDEGVRRLAVRFYAVMADRDDAAPIRNMHADDLGPVSEKLTSFLRGWLGGPRDYFQRPDSPCIMSLHRALPIGEAERDQWLACMDQALQETVPSAELRAMLSAAFARMANAMRSR